MRRVAFLATCLVIAAVFIGSSCPTDPSVPVKPMGNTSVYQYAQETFTTVATSTKDVHYVFTWGDNKNDTTEVMKGGDTASATHAWLTAGNFTITAIAINADGKASAASEGLAITVSTHAKPPAPESIQGQPTGTPRDKILIWTRADMVNPSDSYYIMFQHPSATKATSGWLGPVPNGTYVYDTVQYTGQGDYNIVAFTKDMKGAVSDSSPVKQIKIGPIGLAWSYHTDATDAFMFSAPIMVQTGNLIIYGVTDGDSVFAFTDGGGNPHVSKAAVPIDQSFATSAVLSSDGTKLYVGGDDGKLYCLNSTTLAENWSFVPTNDTTRRQFATPAVNGNTIYVGRDDGILYALTDNGSSATPKWTYTVGSTIAFAPSISSDGTKIFFGNDSSGVCCGTDAGSSLTLLWNSTIGGGLTSAIALDAAGNAWCGQEDGRLYELSPDSGKVLYSGDTNFSNVIGSPVIDANHIVYAVRDNGDVFAVNSATGAQVWYTSLPNSSCSGAPCLAADTSLIIHTDEDVLFALSLTTGNPIWQYTIPIEKKSAAHKFGAESGSSATIGPVNQRIYVGAQDGFYAVSVNKASYAAGLGAGPWPKFSHDLKNTGWAGQTVTQ
jgi:outer membrane protein assembly factor BamB